MGDVPRKSRQASILLVDDEEMILELYQEFLSTEGYKVITGTDGEEALKLFQKDPNKFDLVITDQTMPKMTGIKLAEIILGIRQDIPVILCTGNSALIDESKMSSLGIRIVLGKPFTPNQLLEKVEDILREKG